VSYLAEQKIPLCYETQRVITEARPPLGPGLNQFSLIDILKIHVARCSFTLPSHLRLCLLRDHFR